MRRSLLIIETDAEKITQMRILTDEEHDVIVQALEEYKDLLRENLHDTDDEIVADAEDTLAIIGALLR